MESVISASVIVLVVRSRRPFFKSKPGRYLLLATLVIIGITLALPFTPIGKIFGFTPLPASFFWLMGIIVVLYVISAEVLKTVFYKK
jgi:Mg2+-importing ATPase